MKHHTLFFLLFSFVLFMNCSGQEPTEKIHITDKTTGFSMVLPAGFIQLDQKESKEALSKGKEFLDKTYQIDIDISDVEPNLFKKEAFTALPMIRLR